MVGIFDIEGNQINGTTPKRWHFKIFREKMKSFGKENIVFDTNKVILYVKNHHNHPRTLQIIFTNIYTIEMPNRNILLEMKSFEDMYDFAKAIFKSQNLELHC